MSDRRIVNGMIAPDDHLDTVAALIIMVAIVCPVIVGVEIVLGLGWLVWRAVIG